MALITCTECRKEVSSKAASCPHCGAPIQPAGGESFLTRNRGCGDISIGCLAGPAIIVFVLIIMLNSC